MYQSVLHWSEILFMWIGILVIAVIICSIFIDLACKAIDKLHKGWALRTYQTSEMQFSHALRDLSDELHRHPLAYEALHVAANYAFHHKMNGVHKEDFKKEVLERAARNLGTNHPLLQERVR